MSAHKAPAKPDTLASACGRVDGLRHGALDRGCDPRGGFIDHPELSESVWREYRDAYDASYIVATRGRK